MNAIIKPSGDIEWVNKFNTDFQVVKITDIKLRQSKRKFVL